jgi:hypothetical protein
MVCLLQVVPSSDTQMTVGVLELIDMRPLPSDRTWPLYGPAGTVDRLHEIFSGLPPADAGYEVSGVKTADDVVVGVGGAVGRGAVLDVLADVGDTDAGDVAGEDVAADGGTVVGVAGVDAGPTAALDPHAASMSAPQITERAASL